MKSIISKYLRDIIDKVHIALAIELDDSKSGISNNPVLKNVKPRSPEEIEMLETEGKQRSKGEKRILPEDRTVEKEKIITKSPDLKPTREKKTPGKWNYSETMREYKEQYRQDGNERYIKKK